MICRVFFFPVCSCLLRDEERVVCVVVSFCLMNPTGLL